MSEPATINPRIVEALYCEALLLSDEVRAAFTLSDKLDSDYAQDEDLARISLSSEGLRTTTRMMHAIAWLLNHRAYFRGEINEMQLRRNGRLSPDMRLSDSQESALLSPATTRLVDATRRFYERLLRLDQSWRFTELAAPSALQSLRDRIERRITG
ncbi:MULTISPECIES: DUF1465 family protein [unclassified Novosphingobium]|uniref:DUF1465 family protein n=1 Tax=unclassified Novosphingobium TaxID=2644732 RepID=UPI00135756F9|nr:MULTISPECIES: DUF1465 family protein [unclassified Novosphingobium]